MLALVSFCGAIVVHWTEMRDARLIKVIPKERLRLIRGDSKPPSVGDLGETDQAWSTREGQMRLVYFLSDDGNTEWEAEAYDTELEPYSE